jgi:hypothetical protein
MFLADEINSYFCITAMLMLHSSNTPLMILKTKA